MDKQSSRHAPVKNNSHLSDAQRAFLSNAAYPVSAITPVTGNTGNWIMVGDAKELGNGLEIYALRQEGSNEVVFAVRGSDFEPDGKPDWGLNGANVAFSGTCHPQVEAALTYVNEFMTKYTKSEFIYSTAGHSKGGGISQIIAHTFGLKGTAIDPIAAGAVIQSPGYTALVAELGIIPSGIPEHGFTNYVEKGSLVGDSLEDLSVAVPNVEYLHGLIERYTSLDVGEDSTIHIGSHLGDTVKVELKPGSVLDHFNVLEQHDPFDDLLALATQGSVGFLGNQIEERLATLRDTEESEESGNGSAMGSDRTNILVY